jgi:hypothetical protein
LIHVSLSPDAQSPRQLWLHRGLSETLKLRLSYRTQVTCAREAAYSGDNMGDRAYIDIRTKPGKKQLPAKDAGYETKLAAY